MKAMPLLLNINQNIKIENDKDTAIIMNSMALMQLTMKNYTSFSHWTAMAGGYMYKMTITGTRK